MLKFQSCLNGLKPERPCRAHHSESDAIFLAKNGHCMIPEMSAHRFVKQGNFDKKGQLTVHFGLAAGFHVASPNWLKIQIFMPCGCPTNGTVLFV